MALRLGWISGSGLGKKNQGTLELHCNQLCTLKYKGPQYPHILLLEMLMHVWTVDCTINLILTQQLKFMKKLPIIICHPNQRLQQHTVVTWFQSLLNIQ